MIHGRFTSPEGIYVPKNRLFVFVFILETLWYTAFRNSLDTFVCPKFRVGSHVVPPGDRVRKRSIATKPREKSRPGKAGSRFAKPGSRLKRDNFYHINTPSRFAGTILCLLCKLSRVKSSRVEIFSCKPGMFSL